MGKKQQISNVRASAVDFNSTKAALHVQILDSTGGIVDQGMTSTQVSIREILTSSGVSVMDSTNNSIGVTIRAGSAAGTEYTDGDVDATPSGGAIFFDNSSNTMRVVSAANPLPITGASASTQVSVREILTSSNASVMDSTQNSIAVTIREGSAAGSTQVAISSGVVQVQPISSSGASLVSDTVPASTAQAVAVRIPAPVWDSTNNALRVFQAESSGGASSTQVAISSGVVQVQPISSSGASLTTNATPASTAYALQVREVEHSTGPFQVSSLGGVVAVSPVSTASVRVVQSSAAELNVTVAGYVAPTTNVAISSGVVQVQHITSSGANLTTNTTPASTAYALITRQVDYVAPTTGPIAISSIAGRSLVDQNSTVWVAQVSTVAGRVLVDQNSTVWPVQVSSVAGRVEVGDMSTLVAPASGSSGLVVRLPAPITDSTNNAIRVFQVASSGGASSTQVAISSGVVQVQPISSSGASLVTDAVPASTAQAIAVRLAAPVWDSTNNALRVFQAESSGGAGSTQVAISSGVVQVQQISSSGASLVSDAVPASTAQAIAVRIPAPIWDSTNNALRVFQAESSGGAGSTQVAISSGVVQVQHITSSGGSLTTNATPGSTAYAIITRQVDYVAPTTGPIAISSIAGRTLVDQNSTDWVTQVSTVAGRVLVDQNSTVWPVQVSSVAGRVEVGDMSTLVAPASGSSGLVVRLPAPITDSTNNAIRVFQVASSGGAGSTQVSISSGVVQVQHISSSGVSMSTDTAPASTAQGLIVRQVGYTAPSTGPLAISSVAGRTLVDQNSTVWVVQLPSTQTFQVKNSTIGDLLASVQQNSTTWAVQAANFTSSGGGVEGSTGAPATNALGLHVRNITPGLNSTTVVIAPADSTTFTQVVAGSGSLKHKAYAYFVGSDVTVASTMIFFSGTNAAKWAVEFGSESSGVTGANLAVTPPASLFETAAGAALNVRIESASTVNARLAISYFSEL